MSTFKAIDSQPAQARTPRHASPTADGQGPKAASTARAAGRQTDKRKHGPYAS